MRAFILALALSTAPAYAGKKADSAEMYRLGRETEKLAEKNAWSGVDRNYGQMVALESKDVVIPVDIHMLGAQAARARGSVLDTWRRLKSALEQDPMSEEAMVWLANIGANYGEVNLVVSPAFKDEVVLEALDVGFAPDQRTTIDAARAALTEERRFDGLLPLGRYRLGHVPFDIVGEPRFTVTLKRPKPEEVP